MDRLTQLHQRATIGIITALPTEFSAVKIMLQSPIEWLAPGEGAGRRYLLGEIRTANSATHAIVLALLTDVGTNSAAVSATNLLHHFPSVRHIIMCGIAGGIPSPASPEDSVRLGDIVVSDRKGVVSYDFINQTPDAIKELHPPPPPGAELLEAVRFLEVARLNGHRPWENFLDLSHTLVDATRPRDNQASDGSYIDYPLDSKRKPGLPRLFYSPIASANRLLKDAKFRDELHRRFKTKAVEMEGSGIADATWLGGRAGYLVVRGICDFCDLHKGDLWQGYAAVVAAAYVRALLESMPALPLAGEVHANPATPINQDYPPTNRQTPPGPRAPDQTTSTQSQTPKAPSPSPGTASPTTGHAQPQRRTSRFSTLGCMVVSLLLIMSASGLAVLPDKAPSSDKAPSPDKPPKNPEHWRSIFKMPADTVTSPAPSTPLVPVSPPPSIHTSSEGLPGLRRLHGVRALQDAESGKPLPQVPAGTFGYIEPQSPEHLPQARIRNSPALGPLEVHKLDNGSIMIVGFARDADIRPPSQGRRPRLTLFRTASIQAKTAVAIPVERIRSLLLAAPGEIMLELSPPL